MWALSGVSPTTQPLGACTSTDEDELVRCGCPGCKSALDVDGANTRWQWKRLSRPMMGKRANGRTKEPVSWSRS